jgi:hypothetical protein
MGYYMRYIVGDSRVISLDLIERALKTVDPGYHLAARNDANEFADLRIGSDVYGELEINRRDSELMQEELEELAAEIEELEAEPVTRIKALLETSKAIVVVRVLSQGRTSENTLNKIAPLWDFLFKEYTGLLYADGEGYYDAEGEVLMVA